MKNKLSELRNNLTKEKVKENTKSFMETTKEKTSDLGGMISNKTSEIYNNREEITSGLKEKVSGFRVLKSKKSKDEVDKPTENKKGVDLFNSKIRQKSLDDYNEVVKEYELISTIFTEEVEDLYYRRMQALDIVKKAEEHINQIANTPKEFEVELKKIKAEITSFESKEAEILKAEKEAKMAAAGSGAGATLSSLGIAVATMGPTAAMGVATAFGTASTGTAISALSGAAATNAALAWLGGGAIAAGGGGMSAGTALLALAGPVGWTIAGVALTASVGSGIFASSKNLEAAETLVSERKNLETIKKKFEGKTFEIQSLNNVTKLQEEGLSIINKQVIKTDYATFTDDEKLQAGVLVNSTFTLAELINKELSLDD